MKSFVLFDRKTGEILQTHVRPDELAGDREELLRTLRPEKEAAALDVLEVEKLVPGTSYRVDVKSKRLVTADAGKVKGSGGASVQRVDGDPRTARTVVIRVDQGNQQER